VRFYNSYSEVLIHDYSIFIVPFYSFEMILVGIILLSAMVIGGLKIWIKRKTATLEQLDLKEKSESQHKIG